MGYREIAKQLTGFIKKTGDTMTGFLTLHANPTANMHAATKQYVDNAVKDDIYKANLAKETSIASSQFAVSLTIPAGKYFIFVSNEAGAGEGNNLWLTYNNTAIPSISSYEYCVVGGKSSQMRVLEFTTQTTLYLYNFNGQARAFPSGTSIVAVKVK